MKRFTAVAIAAAFTLAACSSSINTPAPIPQGSSNPPPPSHAIQHVVILLQENRSFNNIFMGFPGAETSTTGKCKEFDAGGSNPIVCKGGQIVKLQSQPLQSNGIFEGGIDIDHGHQAFKTETDEDPATHVYRMDGFGSIDYSGTRTGTPAGTYPYAYVQRKEVQPYWDMAAQYTLADHMFTTATTDSFVAHQEIIAGTTALNNYESITDVPSDPPWGCDAPNGTVTHLLLKSGVENYKGPFPCFTQWKTMADVLDAANVSWKYYVESYDLNSPYADNSGLFWNGFDAIKAVRYGHDWKNVTFPNTAILDDIKKGKLPQVSWVIPKIRNSDHPISGASGGPSWVTAVVNAVGQSQYWKNTAVVVMWDDWGGWYDPVAPPQLDYTSLGLRVPMIVISAFAKRHRVSKTQYEFGSVLKFIEQNFGTASLGTTDVRANSIVDVFDFTQKPGSFQPFRAPYSPAYFLRARPDISPQQLIKNDGGIPD